MSRFHEIAKPYNWPQDALEVPGGGGNMPPISRGNREVARSEFTAYSANFAVPDNQAAGAVQSAFIPTDQDGDFWCNQIAAVCFVLLGGAPNLLAMVVANMDVRDARTQQQLFYPDTVPINMFRKFSYLTPFNYNGREPNPSGFRQTGTLMQPFCFTRQGGIQVNLSFPNATAPATGSYQLTVMFSGWKEYANASE